MARPKAFGHESWTLDSVWNRETNTFFKPYIPPDYAAPFEALRPSVSPGRLLVRSPILVSIIDTGVLMSHPMLAGGVEDSLDYTGEGIEDKWGHGTIVALMYAATLELSGHSPWILNAKVMDRSGNCQDEWIADAIRWSVRKGARIINLCIGYDDEDCHAGHQSLCEAIAEAYGANVLVNVAAEARCPAQCEGSIAVGGVLLDGTLITTTVPPAVLGQGEAYMVPCEVEPHTKREGV